jgi:hypothetical protein
MLDTNQQDHLTADERDRARLLLLANDPAPPTTTPLIHLTEQDNGNDRHRYT